MGSLVYTTTTIPISDDLTWPDEFSWPPVAQSKGYGLAGALFVESAAKLSGRVITLQSEDQYGWTSRANVVALRALVATPGIVMVLTFRGRTFNVMFDHEAGALDAQPVTDFNTYDDADLYAITLRLIEIVT